MQECNNATTQERKNARTQGGAGEPSVARPAAFLHFCILALLGVSAACTHGQARTTVELPPLNMPSPPPRVVEASAPPQSPVLALPDEPHTNVLRPSPAPPPRADAPRPAEPTRAEQTAAEPSRPVDDPARTPSTILQTAPAQREGEMERRVRILIAQAFNDLNRVNYQALNADARNQYDTARRFAGQAEDALRARNLVFAGNLADKAAALAAQLSGR